MSKDKKASAKPAAKKDAKKVVVQAKPKAAKPAAKAEPKLVTRAQVIQETKTAGKKVEAIGNALAKSDDKSKAATGKQLAKAGQALVKTAQKAEAKAPVKIVSRKEADVAKTAGKKVVEVQVKKPTASKSNAKRDLNSELLEGMKALKDEREGKVKLKTITPAAAPAKKPATNAAVKVEAKPAPVIAKAARTRSSLDNKARDIAGE